MPRILSPTCPLCHTLDQTITSDTLQAGAAWVCTRCGQTWSDARLTTAAAYAHYAAARETPAIVTGAAATISRVA
jgi:transposase-like protein